MQLVSSEINLRIIFIITGAIVLLIAMLRSRLTSASPNLRLTSACGTRLADFETQVRELGAKYIGNWQGYLAILALLYFIIAAFSKYSQYQCSLFSGQDFWLFDDMLDWMSKGFPYITRFAGQASGPLQHGAIHPFVTWFLAVPYVWLFGSTPVAILLNAALLALGGWCLGHLSFQRTRSPALALILPLAFWMSEWTNRTLLYETHPETAYPLLVFAAALPFLVNTRSWQRLALTILVWFCLVGLKQDAIVIAGCLWLWLTLSKQISFKISALLLALILGLSFEMAKIVAHFKSGLGPSFVRIGAETFPVALPASGSGALGGHTISDFASLVSVLTYLRDANGGIWPLLKNIASYFTTSPFLPFVFLAPWTILNRWFWILVFPLAFLNAVLGGQPAGLQNYYSITLVSLFWVMIVISFSDPSARLTTTRRKAIWVFCFAALYGSTAPKFYRASDDLLALQVHAKEVATHLAGVGIVSSRLLNVVPREKVWSEKPILKSIPANISWVLLPKTFRSYEDNDERNAAFKREALASGDWRLDEQDDLELYTRRQKSN